MEHSLLHSKSCPVVFRSSEGLHAVAYHNISGRRESEGDLEWAASLRARAYIMCHTPIFVDSVSPLTRFRLPRPRAIV